MSEYTEGVLEDLPALKDYRSYTSKYPWTDWKVEFMESQHTTITGFFREKHAKNHEHVPRTLFSEKDNYKKMRIGSFSSKTKGWGKMKARAKEKAVNKAIEKSIRDSSKEISIDLVKVQELHKTMIEEQLPMLMNKYFDENGATRFASAQQFKFLWEIMRTEMGLTTSVTESKNLNLNAQVPVQVIDTTDMGAPVVAEGEFVAGGIAQKSNEEIVTDYLGEEKIYGKDFNIDDALMKVNVDKMKPLGD